MLHIIKSNAKILAVALALVAFPTYADDTGSAMMAPTSGAMGQSSATATTMASDTAINSSANDKISSLTNNNQIAAGANLQVATTAGAVTVTGTVAAAGDINTVKNALASLNGVKSVNTDAVTVSTP